MAGIDEKFHTTDTGVDLYWTVFQPAVMPAPAVVLWHAGGHKSGNRGSLSVAQDLANAGFVAYACDFRLAPPHFPMNSPQHPSPAQNDVIPVDDGYYPEQTDDCVAALDAIRADVARCNGHVYAAGGSSGGDFVANMAMLGLIELGVVMSCGLSNYADPLMWALAEADNETNPHFATANYLHIPDTFPNPPTGADLIKAQDASAVYKIPDAPAMPPLFIMVSSKDSRGIPNSTGVNIRSYERDGTPIEPPELGTNGLIPNLIAKGYVESTADFPEAGTYKFILVETSVHSHAFQYWKQTGQLTTNPPNVGEIVKRWLLAGPPAGGGTIPPPPQNDLTGYRLTVTGGPGSVNPQPAADDQTALIEGLEPDTDYVAHLVAKNAYGDSPEATFAFRTPPDVAPTEKTQPRGMMALISSPGGQWGDLPNTTTFPFWTLAHIDGSRARSGWNIISPTARGAYDWAQHDALLDLCTTYNKKCGLSVAAGISMPQWAIDDEGARFFPVSGPKAGNMALPWDLKFVELWREFNMAMGAKYDAHPKLAYMVMGGMGQDMESVLVDTPDQPDLDIIAQNDGFIDAADGWLFGGKLIIADFMIAFPTTPCILTADLPVKGQRGREALQDLVDWAVATYGTRFGLRNASLNANTTTGYFPAQVINQYAATNPVGWQMVSSSTNHRMDPSQPDDETYDATLAFQRALAAGIALGMKFVEVYMPDAQNPDTDYVTAMEDARTAMALNP